MRINGPDEAARLEDPWRTDEFEYKERRFEKYSASAESSLGATIFLFLIAEPHVQ